MGRDSRLASRCIALKCVLTAMRFVFVWLISCDLVFPTVCENSIYQGFLYTNVPACFTSVKMLMCNCVSRADSLYKRLLMNTFGIKKINKTCVKRPLIHLFEGENFLFIHWVDHQNLSSVFLLHLTYFLLTCKTNSNAFWYVDSHRLFFFFRQKTWFKSDSFSILLTRLTVHTGF